MYKSTKKAYMTIEASMVFPLVLGGIIFTIYLGLYLYNTAVIKQVTYIAALRGSRLTEVSSAQIKSYVEEQLQQLTKEKLLAGGKTEQKVTVSFYEIRVEAELKMSLPYISRVPFWDKLWEIKSEAKVNRTDPVAIIRGVRKIDESKISE